MSCSCIPSRNRLVEEIDKAKTDAEYNPLALLKNTKSESLDQSCQRAAPKSEESQPLRNRHSKCRQTILLSATLSKGVSELAEFAMKNHEFVDALDKTSNSKMQSNTLIIPDTVKQEFIMTYVKHRLFTLSALIVAMSKKNSKVFVFMASTQMVDFHYDLFTRYLVNMPKNRGKLKTGNVVLLDEDLETDSEEEEEAVLDMPIFKLHGSMDQKARKEVFTGFRAASKGVLLCTVSFYCKHLVIYTYFYTYCLKFPSFTISTRHKNTSHLTVSLFVQHVLIRVVRLTYMYLNAFMKVSQYTYL